MINVNNWGHTCFSSGEYRVAISLGADISTDNDASIEYFLNKYHGDVLIFQEKFSTLEGTIAKANSTYKIWTFVDLEKKLHSGGCSTCQAHD
jgi:hypothetical protein